jgi:DNA-binding PadR family transcriptional regulator
MKDAFTGGVEPGGLWNQNDIRILICYVLTSVKAPLSGEDLGNILQGKALANYFEVSDALASLVKQGNVAVTEKGYYQITENGREIADNLDATLPLSVRDKALEAAVSLLARAKTERENKVEIEKTKEGYQVSCHISGGEMDLMRIDLYVPEEAQAEMVKKNFHRDPGGMYRLLLAALTEDKGLMEDYLRQQGC